MTLCIYLVYPSKRVRLVWVSAGDDHQVHNTVIINNINIRNSDAKTVDAGHTYRFTTDILSQTGATLGQHYGKY